MIGLLVVATIPFPSFPLVILFIVSLSAFNSTYQPLCSLQLDGIFLCIHSIFLASSVGMNRIANCINALDIGQV